MIVAHGETGNRDLAVGILFGQRLGVVLHMLPTVQHIGRGLAGLFPEIQVGDKVDAGLVVTVADKYRKSRRLSFFAVMVVSFLRRSFENDASNSLAFSLNAHWLCRTD